VLIGDYKNRHLGILFVAVCVLLALADCAGDESLGRSAFENDCDTVPKDKHVKDVERRSWWQGRVDSFTAGMDEKEVQEYVSRLRQGNPLLQDRRFFDAKGYAGTYALDETWQLYVSYGDATPRKALSWRVIGFPDLRGEVEPSLYPSLRAIHQAPHLEAGAAFNPVLLLRAAAALHPLGKDGALRALHAYYILAGGWLHPDSSHGKFGSSRIYDLSGDRIFAILRCLFVMNDGQVALPPPILGAADVPSTSAFPLFPIAMVKDVPFLVNSGYFLLGVGECPLDQIDFCREHCKLRAKPLSPSVNPLEAAALLTASREWNLTFSDRPSDLAHRTLVREEALRAVASSYVVFERDYLGVGFNAQLTLESEWQIHRDHAQGLGVSWDRNSLDFLRSR